MHKRLAVTLAVAMMTAAAGMAQEAKKPLSPPAKAEGSIAGAKISVDYAAPSKRNRAIFGSLVPYGKVWRTGANAATTFTTSGDVMIGNLHVPAGKYTLYTIPGEKDWTLIVNKQTGQWGSNYDDSQDLGRVQMTVKKLTSPVETFAIAVKPTTGKNGLLTLTWDNTEASVPVIAH